MLFLSLIHIWLKELYPGYSLIIYDAARPMSVQQKMWNVVKGTSQNIYAVSYTHLDVYKRQA